MLQNAQGVTPATQLQSLAANNNAAIENLKSHEAPKNLDLNVLDDKVDPNMMDAEYIKALADAKKKLLERRK